MYPVLVRVFIVLSLLSLGACTTIKDKPLSDMAFIIHEAYPPSEKVISDQTEDFRMFSEDLQMMDSIEYFTRIAHLEDVRADALKTLKTGIEQVKTLTETNGENLIKEATLTFLRELLDFEKELFFVLRDGKREFNASTFYSAVYDLYTKHDLKSKGDVFVEKQYEFMQKFNITQRDIDKIKSAR